uniref:Uncharacterized protein n=1 Tax=Arundo donax TaxID=35708 RepID=A0A0A8ZF32_ARUDO
MDHRLGYYYFVPISLLYWGFQYYYFTPISFIVLGVSVLLKLD